MTAARRRWLAGLGPPAALAAYGSLGGWARSWADEAFPSRPVRVVVPFSVGLGPDVVMRVLADHLAHRWNRPVLIDNRPGASGIVALIEARGAPRDGHTLVLGEAGSLAVLPVLRRPVGYDPLRDFEPLTTVFRATFALLVGAQANFPDLAALISQARQAPGRISYGSLGNGHVSQVAVERLAEQIGTTFHHVPFRDGAQLMTSVAQGDVDFTAISMHSAAGFVKGGRLRALAVAGARRLKDWPALATLPEAGGPALEMTPWAALMLPAGAPPGVAQTLRTALLDALGDPAVRAKVESMGFEVLPGTPAQLVELIRAETDLAHRLIRLGRLSAE